MQTLGDEPPALIPDAIELCALIASRRRPSDVSTERLSTSDCRYFANLLRALIEAVPASVPFETWKLEVVALPPAGPILTWTTTKPVGDSYISYDAEVVKLEEGEIKVDRKYVIVEHGATPSARVGVQLERWALEVRGTARPCTAAQWHDPKAVERRQQALMFIDDMNAAGWTPSLGGFYSGMSWDPPAHFAASIVRGE